MADRPRPVLATGAGGQLARSLVEAAPQAGVRLVALGRPELDVTLPETLERAFAAHDPLLVVNCAAYTAVDQAESEERQAMAVNADGAEALARLCSRAGIAMIHVSTDYVFDGTKAGPYREDDPTGPTGAYGRSKLEGENRVAAACLEHIILRTAWLYSPHGHNFVKTMLRLAGERARLSVVDDQVGCPTYAPHLAAAILAVARQLVGGAGTGRAWGIYHAAGSGETSWCGFAREVFAQSAGHGGPTAEVIPISTADHPTPARRPANSRLDCSLLKQRFGVTLPHWREGVGACVARLLECRTPA